MNYSFFLKFFFFRHTINYKLQTHTIYYNGRWLNAARRLWRTRRLPYW